jgi:hypothetical protein
MGEKKQNKLDKAGHLRKNKLIIILHLLLQLLLIISWATIGITQEQAVTIDKAEQNEVIAKICDILNKNYVYPETAKKMSDYISDKLKKGEYDSLTSATNFAAQVMEDLRKISNDKHIGVSYDPKTVKLLREEKKKHEPETPEKYLKQLRKNNFGFKEVKILDGNVGYLDLRQFALTKYAGETAVGAMNFLAHCDALIIDIRKNGGGNPDMIQLITSYFYDQEEPIHLNSFYWRDIDKTVQFWTLPYIPGNKMADIDIYVLTSRQTFSAAEEFCYNLKNLKRATLIGETTGGGAHPGGPMIINDSFLIWVPKGRAINPITNTNWEGVGVKPDIEVPQEDALKTAHLKALEKLAANAKNEDDKFTYNWYIDSLKIELNPVEVEPAILKSYAGKYGPRAITFENGELYYQLENRPKYKMIPLSKELFVLKGIPSYRIKFIMEKGQVNALMGFYDNGETVTLFQK